MASQDIYTEFSPNNRCSPDSTFTGIFVSADKFLAFRGDTDVEKKFFKYLACLSSSSFKMAFRFLFAAPESFFPDIFGKILLL